MCGCISEPSGGKSQRHLSGLIEESKRKTQVKSAAQIKGLSDSLLREVKESWQKPFGA